MHQAIDDYGLVRGVENITYIDIVPVEAKFVTLDLVPDVCHTDLHAIHHQVLLKASIHFQSVLATLLRCEAIIDFFFSGGFSVLAYGARFARLLLWRRLCSLYARECHACRCRT